MTMIFIVADIVVVLGCILLGGFFTLFGLLIVACDLLMRLFFYRFGLFDMPLTQIITTWLVPAAAYGCLLQALLYWRIRRAARHAGICIKCGDDVVPFSQGRCEQCRS